MCLYINKRSRANLNRTEPSRVRKRNERRIRDDWWIILFPNNFMEERENEWARTRRESLFNHSSPKKKEKEEENNSLIRSLSHSLSLSLSFSLYIYQQQSIEHWKEISMYFRFSPSKYILCTLLCLYFLCEAAIAAAATAAVTVLAVVFVVAYIFSLKNNNNNKNKIYWFFLSFLA